MLYHTLRTKFSSIHGSNSPILVHTSACRFVAFATRFWAVCGLGSQPVDREAETADDAFESLTITWFWHRLLAADRQQSQDHRHCRLETARLDCQAFDRSCWHPASEELLVQLRRRPAEPAGLGTNRSFGNSSCTGPKSIETALDIEVEMGTPIVENGQR